MRFGPVTMETKKEAIISDNLADRLTDALFGIAEVIAIYTSKKEMLLKARPLVDLSGLNGTLESRLSSFGYDTEILSTEPSLVVRLKPIERGNAGKVPWLNIGLFIVTIFSTLAAGALQRGVDWFIQPGLFLSDPMLIFRSGLPFSISLLAILLCHEFGHYIAGRIHGVNVSLPYFIPAPTLIGTFGAVIRSRSAFMNRKQLLDVGASGPLAGLVVAIAVLIIGVNMAPNINSHDLILGNSILGWGLSLLASGNHSAGFVMYQNSVTFAGWVGLLVTMLNLLPIGQLDGGHIMYALFGRKQIYMANAVLIALIILSFWWLGWAIWLVFAILMKPAHPSTLMDEVPLSTGRKIIGYLSIVAFILCFVPIPVTTA